MKKLLLILVVLFCAIAEPQAQITSGGIATPTIASVTESGTIAAGAKSLTFVFSQDFTGTVLGVAFVGTTDSRISLDAPAGETLTAVVYTVTAGSFRLIKIQ
jgi:hypothetical protein